MTSMLIQDELDRDELPQEYVARAFAFLDCAENLVEQMNVAHFEPTYQRGQAVLWLAFHAVELFLKGCLLHHSPDQPPFGHVLPALAKRFRAAYPAIDLEIPFGSVYEGDDPELAMLASEGDRNQHMRLRYPADVEGNPWTGIDAFGPKLFQATLRRLREHLSEARAKVFDGKLASS